MFKKKRLISCCLPEIRDHLSRHDEWSTVIEWGIGKETFIKIAKVNGRENIVFKVTAELDHVFTCKCPTIERAAEFADIYEDLIFQLYKKNGWPSWHSQSQL